MPVIRVDITGINCKRDESKSEGQVKVMTVAEPRKITKRKIGGQDILVFDFALKTDYEPGVGKIEVEGVAYYTDADLKSKYTEKKGEIQVTPEVTAEVTQAMFVHPAIVAVNMARELRLPMPIQFPRVQLKKPGVS